MSTRSIGQTVHRSIIRTVAVVVIVLTAAGCGQSEPTATPLRATATRIGLEPTHTPLPPTATPVPPAASALPLTLANTPLPPPTATAVPPTDVPSPPTAASVLFTDTPIPPTATVLTEDGNALAVGATNHLHMPPYSGDALLMKLTLEGDVLWERTWGGDGYEQAMSVALAEDGGAYVFGETDSYGAGGRGFFLLKIAAEGSEEWFETYGGSGREWPYGMLRLSNGELLIYGFTETGAGGDRNQYALRLGPDGEVIWEYTVPSPGEELVIDALETADGDLVLAVIVEEDGEMVKLDADGNIRWTNRYELAGWQYASQAEASPRPAQASSWPVSR